MCAQRKARYPGSSLPKRLRKGFHGYPVATIAYYGPDNKRASKVVVGVILEEGGELATMKRWFSETGDVRQDAAINREIRDLIIKYGVKSVGVTDRIIGCPHEEGIDYPEGQVCPLCPFWAHRDRWTGELIH